MLAPAGRKRLLLGLGMPPLRSACSSSSSGPASLGAEIAAARLLAPFFGASTIVWANTIGVVLVALSVGYWLGGRLADRAPAHATGLCRLVLAAAVLLAIVPFAAEPFLDVRSTRSTRSRRAPSSARCSASSCWSRRR